MTTPKKPWHERHRILGWFRRAFRNLLFGSARKMLATDDGRDMLTAGLDDAFVPRFARPPGLDAQPSRPYPDLGEAPPACDGEGAVLVTGRFRSGSTLLWNLFRHMNGFTAYYEPHNERRWFDPASRGDRIDLTHKKVTNYWAEYEGLTELARHYREEWVRRNLFMDEQSWDPDLWQYTRILLERAKGRAVLQCNRVDFRLGWFRCQFPRMKVVHLYRHPRDQWCSGLMDIKCFPPDGKTADFGPADKFYLLNWCRDLKHHFPFLDERTASHPYQLHYYLWKLSYLFGRHYSDHSLSMEDLVGDPEGELRELFHVLEIDPAGQDVGKLKSLVVPPELGKWKHYAPDEWFCRHEAECEAVLAQFLRAAASSPVPVAP